MSLIIPANTLASGGYQVANSCRFDGTSAYLSRTQGTPTDVDKYTISVWFKRSALFNGAYQNIIGTDHQSVREAIRFNDDADSLTWDFKNASNTKSNITPNQLFRDVAAWYHLVCIFDSANGTANLRRRIFLNGTEITSFAAVTYNAQNEDGNLNKGGQNIVIGIPAAANNFFSGYMSEFVFVDGQALTPDGNFGEFDEDSGIWKPIDVSGLTFGNNGFYLDFEDSGDLGDDESGNGNDFAETNLAAIDQSTDTCTNNFATLNVLNKGTSVSLSEGNLAYTAPSGSFASVLSTIGFSQGKWYAEYQWKSGSNSHVGIGKENINYNHYLSYTANGYSYYKDGRKFNNSSASSYGNSYAVDDIIGVALDLNNGAIWFSKNGTWQNSATLTEIQNGTTTNAAFTSLSGEFFFGTGMGNSNELAYFNFGSPPYSESGGETDGNGYGNFAHAVPSGFLSLNTKNLSEVLG